MDVEAGLEELRAAVASRDSALSALESQIAAQAVVLAQQAKQLERLAAVEAELAKLREQLGRNSSNSNKPPSSDPPGAKGQRRKKSKRLRGGQKGHRGSHRAMLEPDEVVDPLETPARRRDHRDRGLAERLGDDLHRHQRRARTAPLRAPAAQRLPRRAELVAKG